MPLNLIIGLFIIGGIINILLTDTSQYEDKLDDKYQDKKFADFIDGLKKATTNKN